MNIVEPSIKNKNQLEDLRVVMRLVNNLKYLFNIQSGDYLTFVLGYGECKSNDEALKYWVMNQLNQHLVGHNEVLDFLTESLKEELITEACS